MRVKNVVISSLGVLVIIVAVAGVAWLLRAPEPYPRLILDAVELRSVGNNSLAKAKIIDDMDKNMERVKDGVIGDEWDKLTSCIDAGCTDDSLLDFILSIVIAKPEKVPHARLVADAVVAGRFWGSDDVLKFSKAVTAANDAIAVLKAKSVDKKWDEIVACDGKCAEKNALIFDEVKLIVELGLQP
ncbi:hypothetical protein HY485_02130 [Candidatus Woesearchaeota archaeon]|nr:hypothetical protein [Candidatus Woesearchaeota archaeon]